MMIAGRLRGSFLCRSIRRLNLEGIETTDSGDRTKENKYYGLSGTGSTQKPSGGGNTELDARGISFRGSSVSGKKRGCVGRGRRRHCGRRSCAGRDHYLSCHEQATGYDERQRGG